MLRTTEADNPSGRRRDRVRGTRFSRPQNAADGLRCPAGGVATLDGIEYGGLMLVAGRIVPAHEVALENIERARWVSVDVEDEIGFEIRLRILRVNELDRPIWHRGLHRLLVCSQNSLERLAQIFDAAVEGTILIDQSGIARVLSFAWVSMLKWARGQNPARPRRWSHS
jgi:hypothetical protein